MRVRRWKGMVPACIFVLLSAYHVGSFRWAPVRTVGRTGPAKVKRASSLVPESSGEDALCLANNSAVTGGEQQDAGYYLIWSRGLLQQTASMILGLFLLRFAVNPRFHLSIQTRSAPPFLSGFFRNLILPLFSSACCGIQLIINAFAGAGGCAGFNKKLGPLRPYFLSIMLYGTVVSVSNTIAWTYRKVLAVICQLMLTFLPEIVHFWNVAKERKNAIRSPPSTRHYPFIVDLECSIPSMGCVACINKINASIQNHVLSKKQMQQSRSWLIAEGGGRSSVQFLVRSKEEAGEAADSIAQAIRDAGFDPCIIESLAVKER